VTESAYLAPGAVLCRRYEIVREIGRGGYSVVYLARDRELQADVALKLLVPPPAAAQVARERMRREVQAVRALSHANIVAVFDFLEEGPWSFIVMEYVAGPDLQVRVRDRGVLDADAAVRTGRDIAAALTAAHRRGILHRDVKPQNILLDPDGRARLTDFGSAKLDGQLGMTATGALAGTLAYTAPEVLAGRRGDARADVYALGLTLYYALTGELPERPSGHLPPTSSVGGYHPRGVAPIVPQWLDEVIAHATSAAVEDRFPTASALDQALARPGAAGLLVTGGGETCILCNGPDPLATGLCPACGGGSAGMADTLIFLRPPAGASERRAMAIRLTTLLPDVSASAAQAAASGERPLFRVAAVSASRLVDALGRRELAAHPLPVARAWSAVPASLYGLTAAVLLGGTFAGSVAEPLLLWTSPFFGALLLVGAHQSVRSPVVTPSPRRADLPRAVEEAVLRTLADVAPGTARGLLADLVRAARALFVRLERTGDDRGLVPALTELIISACSAASDLAQLDENLGRFERQRERFATLPPGWLDGLARCERTRDALVQRLLEAMTVLGKLQNQSAELADADDPTLPDLTRELQAEARAQSEAAEEVEALLAVSPERNKENPQPAG
jgi:predicted Ser/Thr protein kinase